MDIPEWQPRPASWWERHIVPRLIGCACAQPQIMKARSRIVPQASGDVLELGCGGGINMAFYDPSKINSFSGVDPSPALLDRSREAAQAIGLDADIRGGIGEALPFDDASFDTVLITFAVCFGPMARLCFLNMAQRLMHRCKNGSGGLSLCGNVLAAAVTSPAPSCKRIRVLVLQSPQATKAICPNRRARSAG